jgi:long-chain acyl-CoA synthetase
MFHVFALTTVLNFSVEIGAEMVLLPRFNMAQMLATMKRKPPTQFFGVPTIYGAMNELPKQQIPDLSRVRACISGGAPLPLEVRESFEKRTGARVVEGYGLSESAPIIACNPLDGLVKNDSCGPRFPGTILEIRDPAEPHDILPTGERGEVCARGPQIMKGYWRKPAETEAVFVDGALRTGDIGYLDADGYLFLVDRIKDVILCGGYNVYPRMIEDAAYQHPAIKEAIAIAIPDGYRGQSPKLFVALHEGMDLTIPDLKQFLEERLSKIEVPREYEIRESLPKTLIGKLSKKELVEEERARRA